MIPMNRIRQYRPAYFTGFENATVEFDGVEALLAISFVTSFVNESFHQFSIDTTNGDNIALMAEYDDGNKWWVVGFLDSPVDLPRWDKDSDRVRTQLAEINK